MTSSEWRARAHKALAVAAMSGLLLAGCTSGHNDDVNSSALTSASNSTTLSRSEKTIATETPSAVDGRNEGAQGHTGTIEPTIAPDAGKAGTLPGDRQPGIQPGNQTAPGSQTGSNNQTVPGEQLLPDPQVPSTLPPTNLNTKYPPFGVPQQSNPALGHPFVFVLTLDREATVKLHESQLGEKVASTGEKLPVVGPDIVNIGNVINASSAFSAQHDNTCVRLWTELTPLNWGFYATYVTGTECPARSTVTGGFSHP